MTIGRADILAAIRRATPATPPTEHEPCCACCSEVGRLTAQHAPNRSRPCAVDPLCCRWQGHDGEHLYPEHNR